MVNRVSYQKKRVNIFTSYKEHYIFKIKISNILAWNERPTIVISESTNHPIEKVIFPTVTLCPIDSNPDRWGPAIKMFDYLEHRCAIETGYVKNHYKFIISLTLSGPGGHGTVKGG